MIFEDLNIVHNCIFNSIAIPNYEVFSFAYCILHMYSICHFNCDVTFELIAFGSSVVECIIVSTVIPSIFDVVEKINCESLIRNLIQNFASLKLIRKRWTM